MTPELSNNLRVKAQLLEVSRAFAARGIEHGVLKGVPLVLRLYQRLDARWIGDNDLLIPEGAERASIEALQALGYQPKRDPWVGLQHDGRATFKRPDGPDAIVDLHVDAFGSLLFRVPRALPWQHLEQIDVGGHTVQVFDREWTLLHLAAHCAQHAMMEPRILRDLARAWNDWGGEIELERVARVAREHGLIDALMFALWVAQDLGMLVRPPPDWSAPRATRLRRMLSTRRLLRPTQGMPYLRMASMGLLVAPAQRVHLLRTYLFPPAAKLGESPKSIRLWGRYAVRLVRPLLRRA
jgi:hypothetical protein